MVSATDVMHITAKHTVMCQNLAGIEWLLKIYNFPAQYLTHLWYELYISMWYFINLQSPSAAWVVAKDNKFGTARYPSRLEKCKV